MPCAVIWQNLPRIIDTVTQQPDWLQLLTKSENKSRGMSTGKGLRLSSIDGWTEDKLPKLLIVWSFEKISSDAFPSITRPDKFSKKREQSLRVDLFALDTPDFSQKPKKENLVQKNKPRNDFRGAFILKHLFFKF